MTDEELMREYKSLALDLFQFGRFPDQMARWYFEDKTSPELLQACIDNCAVMVECLETLASRVKAVGQEAERNLRAFGRKETPGK